MHHRHYDALLAESGRVGWPERFKTDLTKHDRSYLATRDPALPFAWVLSDAATYLVYPSRQPIDGAGHLAENIPACCENAFGANKCKWYWWDGVRLVEVRSARALAECLRSDAAGDANVAER